MCLPWNHLSHMFHMFDQMQPGIHHSTVAKWCVRTCAPRTVYWQSDAILDPDPKNVLSPAGQCQFNEVVSVVMVRAENHLATSYPCRGRGLLSTSCKMPTGNITPTVSDSVPAMPFYNKPSLFKGFNTFSYGKSLFFLFLFFWLTRVTRLVMFASDRNKSAEPRPQCNFWELPSHVDKLVRVVPGGLTLRFPRMTAGMSSDRSQLISHTWQRRGVWGGPHSTSPLRKKATRNVSRTPKCPLVRYHHPGTEVMWERNLSPKWHLP